MPKKRAKPSAQGKLDAWQQLTQAYPALAESLSGSVVNTLAQTGLDEKTKQLVYIATQTAVCYPLAVQYHVPFALKAGATRDEIVGAAAIAGIAAEPKGFVTCLPTILKATARRRS